MVPTLVPRRSNSIYSNTAAIGGLEGGDKTERGGGYVQVK